MKVKVQLLLFICLTTLNGQVDYTSQIQTIFTNNCTGCHMYGNPSGGLTLTSYEGVMAGGNSGAVIVANDHANSLLWQKVNTGAMPQNNTALPQSQIDLIALWINEGALEFPAVVEKTYVPDDNFEQALIDLGYDDALDDSVLTANISGVTSLNVNDKSISDLTGIEGFTALTHLECNNNQLTSIDVSNNTVLQVLNCGANQLTSLDVSSNTALTEFLCENNQLTSLDVSANTALTWLHFENNQLTSLDVSSNTASEYLNVDGNQLTSLDVSSNTALWYLNPSNNQLTSLDVSSNTALTWLHCDNNQLTALDVSSNTALINVVFNSNQLVSLDVSNNTALTHLYCENNQLTSLDVSSNTSLTVLHCSNNQLTYFNMKNGVTDQLNEFYATNNSSLTCIETLDPAYATANWTSANGNIDAGVTFDVICGAEARTHWYVDTTGSDASGSGTLTSPLSTIQTGINATTEDDTVSVAAGTYVENINYSGKNIAIIGADRETTIIDGGSSASVVIFNNGEDSSAVLSGFTIQNGSAIYGGGIHCADSSNPNLNNLIVKNNLCGWGGGAGIYCSDNSSPTLEQIIIQNNNSDDVGGGIYCKYNSNPILTDVVIEGNSAIGGSYLGFVYGGGGGISCFNSSPVLKNVTISENSSSDFGGGLSIIHILADEIPYTESNPVLVNTIIWNNSPDEIYNSSPTDSGFITISFSDIQGGLDSIALPNEGGIVWGEGNININPLFCNTDYTLAENSPCVGAGENGANMGAFGVGCSSYNFSPTEFSLSAPSNNTQITIDESNMNTGSITFSWGASSDQNGDSLYYLMSATSAEIGDHGMDTNATSIMVSYVDIIEDMSENNVTAAALEWTVYVTDGQDTVEADNAPYTMEIDGANALSAYLEGLLPDEFTLHQNYPNPFNPVTTLRYDLPENAMINITIYDMLGRQVKTLINQTQDAGYRSVVWDATNDYGKPVSAGIYLYQIQAGEYIQTKKMVLLK